MPELQPLRWNEKFTDAKNKSEEALVHTFSAEFPEVALTVPRLCFVVGPNMDNSLSNHLAHHESRRRRKKLILRSSRVWRRRPSSRGAASG